MEVMNCTVRRQVLNIDAPTLVAMSYDYINVKATFSSEWEGMQKWLHIRNVANQTLVGHILFENDEIGEDKGLNLSAGEWDVWIHGAKYEDNTLIKRITTDVKKIKVEATGSDDEILPDVGPSVAEQAVAAAERAEAAADTAEQHAASASDSADDALQYANNAASSATGAEQSATNASRSATSALASATNAQAYANRAEQAVSRYPYINSNGNWMVFNVSDGVFVDTGVSAEGHTFYPHVDNDGTLSWTNDANLPNPEPVNLIDLFINSSPELQATVDGILAEAEAGVADIAEQRDTILASIAAAAELGTDTTLTVAGMAADAKATGDAVGDLKNALIAGVTRTYENLREIPFTFTDGGYIDRDTGNVIEYSNWKYSDYIDISGLTNSYFICLLTTTGTTGSGYNVFYDVNKQKVGNYFPSGINVLLPTILYPGVKYIRISCKTDDKFQLFDDTEKAPINFYRNLENATRVTTDFIPVNKAKYELTTSINTSIEQFSPEKVSMTISSFTGSRTFAKGNNVAYVRLHVAYSNYTLAGIKSITFKPREHYTPITAIRICSFNVGMWNNGVSRQPDATMEEYAINFRRFLGNYNAELICCLEAPTVGNVSGTYDVNNIFNFMYGYRKRFESGDNTGKIAYGKNTFLNPATHTFAASGRNYYSFQYNVGRELVTVYLVHLSYETGTEGNRKQDLQEIAGILSSTTHCIVLGDLNTYDMSELDVLSAYNISNGGIFGKFVSWPNVTEEWPNGAIDNIITTPDINIRNVFVADVTLYDHKPVFADVSLY